MECVYSFKNFFSPDGYFKLKICFVWLYHLLLQLYFWAVCQPCVYLCLAITTIFLFIKVWIFLFFFLSFVYKVSASCFLWWFYIYEYIFFFVLSNASFHDFNSFFKCPIFLFMFAGVIYILYFFFLSSARTIVFALKFTKRN